MLQYVYKCPNEECQYHDFYLTLTHSMADCDIPHYCPLCSTKNKKSEMTRIIQVPKYGMTVNDSGFEIIDIKISDSK